MNTQLSFLPSLASFTNPPSADSPRRDIATEQQDSAPELVTDAVNKRVNALLDNLNVNNFGTISDEIIDWANKSESELDGFTLTQVLRIVYANALDASSPMIYARLCRKMMDNISDNVQIDGLRGRDGKPIAGGQLFRRYLLNRVQADFECCWGLKGAGPAAFRLKPSEDIGTAKKDAMRGVEDPFSANYYTPETVVERVLGLVRLIGELFKLQMITERIMHECIQQLIKDGGEPGLESVCGLMRTVGQILDSKPMRPWMDVYFTNMKQLMLDPRIEPRVVRMLKVHCKFSPSDSPLNMLTFRSRMSSTFAIVDGNLIIC